MSPRKGYNKNSLKNLKKGKPFGKDNPGNPGGRPSRLDTLVGSAIAKKLREMSPDGQRTYAEAIGCSLVEALHKRLKGQAKSGKLDYISIDGAARVMDRTEGKSRETLRLEDLLKDAEGRSIQDQDFYAHHGHWPETECSSIDCHANSMEPAKPGAAGGTTSEAKT